MAKAKTKDGNEKTREWAAHWKTQIETAEKDRDRWLKRGVRICERYRDERKTDENVADPARKMNLFWSNVETLKPAVYSKAPQPIVERRFLDKDPTGKAASQILERALRYEMPMSGYHHAVKLARDDYLLVGRGQIWVRYDPKFGEPVSLPNKGDDEATDSLGEPLEGSEDYNQEAEQRALELEQLCVDYVHWQDFYTSRARTWEEVEWVAKRAYLSKQDLKERFGDKVGEKIPLDHMPDTAKADTGASASSTTDGKEGVKATIYEIWCKYDKRVYFIAKGYDECLIPKDVEAEKEACGIDDPLHLEGFFPCPRPIFGTTTNDTLIPVPDYAEVQDQYVQIDELTNRINILTGACKVVGTFDAAHPALKRVFQEAIEPDLIPVDQWAMYAQKGGLKGAIDLVPTDAIAKTVGMLIEVRAKMIEDLDRVTGIWDIMRGTSDARETLGGQRLKQNNGQGRLQDRQDEFARFCRDIVCIMGEIIAEHYSPETLIQVSGALFDEGLIPPAPPPQPMPMQGPMGMPQPPMPATPPMAPQPGMAPVPMAPAGIPMPPMPEDPMAKQQRVAQVIAQAITLLRKEKQRGFRIDIETDSTIQADANQEKEQRILFIEGVTKFIEQAGVISASNPDFTPLAAKMLMFGVRGFRVGRDLESAIEDFADKAEQDAKAAAANPQARQSPEQIKAESEKMKAQAEIEKAKIEAASEDNNAKLNIQSNMIDFEMKKLDVQMKQIELEMRTREMHGNISTAAIEAQGDAAAAQAKSSEGGGGSAQGVSLHPHVVLKQIGDAAQRMESAAAMMNKKKRIVRDSKGKAIGIEPVEH